MPTRPRPGAAAYTLVELCVVIGLGTTLMIGVLTSTHHLLRQNRFALEYLHDVEQASAALDRVKQEIRSARRLVRTGPPPQSNEIALVLERFDGTVVTYQCAEDGLVETETKGATTARRTSTAAVAELRLTYEQRLIGLRVRVREDAPGSPARWLTSWAAVRRGD